MFGALMAALYQRERTGRGTMVSTSLLANGLWLNAIPVQGILCGARTVVRPPREEAVDATGNLYRCRDGRWFLLALTADGRRWPAFAGPSPARISSPIRASPRRWTGAPTCAR